MAAANPPARTLRRFVVIELQVACDMAHSMLRVRAGRLFIAVRSARFGSPEAEALYARTGFPSIQQLCIRQRVYFAVFAGVFRSRHTRIVYFAPSAQGLATGAVPRRTKSWSKRIFQNVMKMRG